MTADKSPVDNYIEDVLKRVHYFDQKEKQEIEADIREELNELAGEKAEEHPELTPQQAEAEAVSDYMDAGEMAGELKDRFQERYDERMSPAALGFSITGYAFIVPLVMLQLPIYYGTFDDVLYRIAPYLFMFLFGAPMMVFYVKAKMTPLLLQNLRYMPVMMLVFLATAAGFLFAHLIRFGEISSFSLIYLGVYLVIWTVFYIVLKKMYRHAQQQVM